MTITKAEDKKSQKKSQKKSPNKAGKKAATSKTAGKKENYLSESSEWTFELLEKYDREIKRIAHEKFKLDTYPNQIEIISAEQMMDAYASSGMPIHYNHWSYGKHFLSTEKTYRRGQMGLAYEIVINSDPCISYLMEENTIAMQALVIAHACYGHNSFFKNNYLFKTWTNADAIIDYLVFAKKYIRECEEKHGINAVEEILDSCHALMNYGIDRYRRPNKLSIAEERERQIKREEHLQYQINELWRTIPKKDEEAQDNKKKRFPEEPEDNLLYFFEKNAPLLEPWQRELVRIVRKMAQYFYPQRLTKAMNEGWACFWHYTILNEMYAEGLVNDGFMLEFLTSHTSVIYQPPYNSPYYGGINPYSIGFNIMSDIRRICEEPTDEDYYWFPNIAGKDWRESIEFAMRNFKDESFIAQYLSPKVMRDMKLFCILDDDEDNELEITAIHNEQGYRKVRQTISEQYNPGNLEPRIQVYNVDLRGNRSLVLRHLMNNRRPLDNKSAHEMLKHVYRLWNFPIILEAITPEGKVIKTYHCPPREPAPES
ncbi:SpoVR family protein [Piscirickettsia salmonis]|uniref:SpoVR family protein n=1 Tax=Piscirickettsia salmonis TaxID=1238 RepID=UPI0012BAD226|nr:SpoVR family protein [Piscirickettsia salmonis]QGP55587.1 SpoVR family protein [Piscirickettsia salmonis]QGP58560.1 SpoVR family protein [Piscirickettsia salmonis]QGP65158.1 SpoVR family protein [Piscirickettsia salmonis]